MNELTRLRCATHRTTGVLGIGITMQLARLQIIARIATALLGGYAFTWGCAVLGIAGLVVAGVTYEQARVAVILLAFLIFLGVFLWSFAAASLLRVSCVLFGGGLTMA